MVPAKKPRTECSCQLVVFIIAAMVAPPGLRSIATTRDCFDNPASVGLDDEGWTDAEFGRKARPDFDCTRDEMATADERFVAGFKGCVVLLRLDLDLPAIVSSMLNDSVMRCHWHNPAEIGWQGFSKARLDLR